MDDYELCLPTSIDFSADGEYQLRHSDVQPVFLESCVTFRLEHIEVLWMVATECSCALGSLLLQLQYLTSQGMKRL
jgi:hypothetical protein